MRKSLSLTKRLTKNVIAIESFTEEGQDLVDQSGANDLVDTAGVLQPDDYAELIEDSSTIDKAVEAHFQRVSALEELEEYLETNQSTDLSESDKDAVMIVDDAIKQTDGVGLDTDRNELDLVSRADVVDAVQTQADVSADAIADAQDCAIARADVTQGAVDTAQGAIRDLEVTDEVQVDALQDLAGPGAEASTDGEAVQAATDGANKLASFYEDVAAADDTVTAAGTPAEDAGYDLVEELGASTESMKTLRGDKITYKFKAGIGKYAFVASRPKVKPSKALAECLASQESLTPALSKAYGSSISMVQVKRAAWNLGVESIALSKAQKAGLKKALTRLVNATQALQAKTRQKPAVSIESFAATKSRTDTRKARVSLVGEKTRRTAIAGVAASGALAARVIKKTPTL